MPREYSGCFGTRCLRDDSDEESDDGEGYEPLEICRDTEMTSMDGGADRTKDANDYFKPADGYQTEEQNGGKEPYSEVDVKGKKLRKKMRRKTFLKRVRHVLHSSWKWFKRGAIAAAPALGTMFMMGPTASTVAVSVAARRQAAKDYNQTPVYF